MTTTGTRAPLTDTIITAVAQIVDDGRLELSRKREPSHSDLEFTIKQTGLSEGDPKGQPGRPPLGKAKRIREVLYWAMEHDERAGEVFIAKLVAQVKGCGGFREDSANYVGCEAIRNAASAFESEGFHLASDGALHATVLENLSGVDLTKALRAYVRRAKRGAADAALVTGTGKDLLEATAAHVLTERYGGYSTGDNFPALLGQAFVTIGFATPQDKKHQGEPVQKSVERAMYELGCAINRLRNKEGTGHGRPWLPSVSDSEAKAAVEFMGILAERLLSAHQEGVGKL